MHPAGRNIVVAAKVPTPNTREVAGMSVTFTGLDALKLE
jgi:hypothetical protein